MGAKSVNVLPSDRPQDVYSDVVVIIEKLVQKDFESGHPTALLLEGKIQRKVVKQTIMTSVYGVTFIGARKQIQNALLGTSPPSLSLSPTHTLPLFALSSLTHLSLSTSSIRSISRLP